MRRFVVMFAVVCGCGSASLPVEALDGGALEVLDEGDAVEVLADAGPRRACVPWVRPCEAAGVFLCGCGATAPDGGACAKCADCSADCLP